MAAVFADISIAAAAHRLAVWLVVCVVSALPCLLIAGDDFDRRAMILGVVIFALAYTVWSCTPWFARFESRPYVRRALYVGYITRMAISIVFPIGLIADLIPGAVSIAIVRHAGLDPESFAGTLATTLIQGMFMNAMLGMYIMAVYNTLRLRTGQPATPDAGAQPRGFDVVSRVGEPD